MEKYLELATKQKTLRDNGIDIFISLECIGDDETCYTYEIRFELGKGKRFRDRINWFSPFNISGGTYSGGWNTYEEALEDAINYVEFKNILNNPNLNAHLV